jgi:DNA invertase Pin-like site-specific DNA recombinase
MREWFYMRLSTQTKGEQGIRQREQSFERQLGIFERCGYVLTEENTFAERISGKTKNEEREQFAKMLEVLEEGDWVYFSETSRFSRSYTNGMEMLDTLIFDKKVNVKFVSNGIELLANNKATPYTWFTISQMLLADELQRRVISYNTANGLQRIKEKGEKKLGAPQKVSDEQREEIKELRKSHTCREIAEMYGVDASTISRIK